MNFVNQLLLIFSSIGVINSLLVSVYLFFTPGKYTPARKILSLLIFMFSLRIGKSVVFYFYPALDSFYINIGLAAFSSVGPLFYLFTLSLLNENFRFKRLYLLHFLPFTLIISFAGILEYHRNPLWNFVYRLVLAQILTYLIIAFWNVKRSLLAEGKSENIVLLRLPDFLFSAFIVWISYFLHAFVHGYPYVLSPLVFTCVFYYLTFKTLKTNTLSKKTAKKAEKYKHISVDDELQKHYTGHLLKILQDEKVYMNNKLTMPELAKMLQISPQLLSFLINKNFNQSFPEFINSYRVRLAQKMLNDPEFKDQTISSIAFECGFNSLSVFNSIFKKLTGSTPSDYRNKDLVN